MVTPPRGMHEVMEKLYLGDWRSAVNVDHVKAHGITHVLTINNHPLPEVVRKEFKHKYVEALDSEETDLLSAFEECYEFIEEGRNNGGILAHCMAGLSRSATIVIAYAMKKNKVSFKEAVSTIYQSRVVNPNEGFVCQLLLYEEMGNKLDDTNNNYRRYKLKQLAQKMQANSEETELESHQLAANPSATSDKADFIFKCRKCRTPLFRRSGCLYHRLGESEYLQKQDAGVWLHKLGHVHADPPEYQDMEEPICDKSLFIEPVQWMKDSIMTHEGKLECPKCKAKLGSFRWYGEKCSCGAWVTPAFHIHTDKVDECKPFTLPVRTVNTPSGGTV